MKKTILIIFTCLSIVAIAQNDDKNFAEQPYIEVTGSAEMEIVPNQIYLAIKIYEKDQKKDLAGVEKLMVDKLEKIGIDVSEKLSVKDMMSNFRNYWLKTSKVYDSRVYQLLVEDVAMAGKVFRELAAIGVSNISIEKVHHTDMQQLKETVKIDAVKAAKTKAAALANAVDETIGKALYIKEIENPSIGALNAQVAGYASTILTKFRQQEIEDEPSIEFEKIKLQYAIEVRFEI